MFFCKLGAKSAMYGADDNEFFTFFRNIFWLGLELDDKSFGNVILKFEFLLITLYTFVIAFVLVSLIRFSSTIFILDDEEEEEEEEEGFREVKAEKKVDGEDFDKISLLLEISSFLKFLFPKSKFCPVFGRIGESKEYSPLSFNWNDSNLFLGEDSLLNNWCIEDCEKSFLWLKTFVFVFGKFWSDEELELFMELPFPGPWDGITVEDGVSMDTSRSTSSSPCTCATACLKPVNKTAYTL